VNAYEAEGRRVSRFTVLEHTPGNIQSAGKTTEKTTAKSTEKTAKNPISEKELIPSMAPATEHINHEYPFTLDLRWHA